jgi:hypothetical protein
MSSKLISGTHCFAGERTPQFKFLRISDLPMILLDIVLRHYTFPQLATSLLSQNSCVEASKYPPTCSLTPSKESNSSSFLREFPLFPIALWPLRLPLILGGLVILSRNLPPCFRCLIVAGEGSCVDRNANPYCQHSMSLKLVPYSLLNFKTIAGLSSWRVVGWWLNEEVDRGSRQGNETRLALLLFSV